MKVLIIEEALHTLHGHWFQYVGDIFDGGRDAGHEITVAVHRDAVPEIRKRFACLPILAESVFGAEAHGRGLKSLRRMVRRNFTLFRELHDHFKSGSQYEIVIATTPRVDHLYAYLLLNLLWGRKAFRQLVLIFVESVGTYSADFKTLRFRKKSLLLKWGMQLTKKIPPHETIVLATESKGLARQFKEFSGIDFVLLPHVTEWRDPPSSRSTKSGSIVLGAYGFTRYDKGTDVLQQALLNMSATGMPVGCHFLIQWTSDFNLPDGQRMKINPTLAKRPDIEYLGAFDSESEFRERMAATDIMILPYRKEFYFDKLSRVAIDAAEAGMPMVYPLGTWLESFVSQYGAGVSFVPEDPNSLAAALLVAMRDFPTLKAIAEERAPEARHAFSSKRFFEILIDLPGMMQLAAPFSPVS